MTRTESLEGTTAMGNDDSATRAIQRSAPTMEQMLAAQQTAYAALDDARLLDLYGEGGLLERAETRTDSICKITAGRRNDKGLPEPSRDGRIVLHDRGNRAPKLKEQLEQSDYRSLIITFDSDRTSDFLYSRFALYTKTKCILQGNDQYLLYRPGDTPPQRYEAASNDPEEAQSYQRLFQWGIQNGMKAEYWIYFHLWALIDKEPRIWYADGMLPYRLVSTSKGGVQNLLTSFKEVRRLTGGHIAVMPFEASIDLRRVSDRLGVAHDNTPIWTFNPKVAEFSLDSRSWIPFVLAAIAQTRDLMEIRMLNPSSNVADADTEADLLQDPIAEGEFREVGSIVTPTREDLDRMAHGGQCDSEQTRKAYFAIAGGTYLATDAGRHAWINEYSGGQFKSTSKAYDHWSQDEARAFLDATKERVEQGAAEPTKPKPQEPKPPAPAEPKPPAQMPDEEMVDSNSGPANQLRELANEGKALGLPPDVYMIGLLEYPAPIGKLRQSYRQLAEHVIPMREQVKRDAIANKPTQQAAPLQPVAPTDTEPEISSADEGGDGIAESEDELMAIANSIDIEEGKGAAV